MRRTLRWALVALLWIAAALLQPPTPASGRGPALAWLGPFADLASNLEWIRFQDARLAGDQERALLHAESALALRPRATEGWQLLASHLGFFLASAAREPDPRVRLAWFRAALEVTRRGAEHAAHPEELALLRGLLLLNKAKLDPVIWPEGEAGLWRAAAEAFDEAAAGGQSQAPELARYARERAEGR